MYRARIVDVAGGSVMVEVVEVRKVSDLSEDRGVA
jgi:hypothetical protein